MTQRSYIFLVEDEHALADTLVLNLKLSNYQVLLARDGAAAKTLFLDHQHQLDLVILDVMLPHLNGKDLCAIFKTAQPSLPVMFLSARSESSDRIEGLKLGADDYLTKPFDLEELLLRISILLKRSPRKASSEAAFYTFSGGTVNFSTYEITDKTGTKHELSKREIKLLELLSQQPNHVVSRDEIIEKLWSDDENASSRTIDNYILNFRKYFEENPKEPKLFHSVRGVGYKFTPLTS